MNKEELKTKCKRRTKLYHVMSIAFIVAALCFSIFRFPNVFFRLIQSLEDVVTSLGYLFTEWNWKGLVKPTILNVTDASISFLPFTWQEFLARLKVCWDLLSDWRHWLAYLGKVVQAVAWIMSIIGPVIIILLGLGFSTYFVYFRKSKRKQKTKETEEQKEKKREKKKRKKKKSKIDFSQVADHDTKPLKLMYKLEDCFKKIFVFFIRWKKIFLKRFKIYRRALIWIWLYNLNFVTIGIELVAYVLFILAKFSNVATAYSFVIKLSLDLMVYLEFVPVWLQVIIGFRVYHFFRLRRGNRKRDLYLQKNDDVLRKNPGNIILIGLQRSLKTTTAVMFTLLERWWQIRTARKGLKKRAKQFPYFPWRNVERTLTWCRKHRVIYSKSLSKEFIVMLREEYFEPGERYFPEEQGGMKKLDYLRRKFGYKGGNFLFGYKTDRYPMSYDAGRTCETIWDALEAYAQLFFIYTTRNATFANHSIRSDDVMIENGNFPEWDLNWQKRRPQDMERDSQYALIGDKDMLRFKTMDPYNPLKDVLEFGVWNEMEMAKEVGNQKTTAGEKRTAEECNRVNDGFSIILKIITHMATVDNDTYFRLIGDDHREDSFGADFREMFNFIRIIETSDPKIALPGFAYEEALWKIGSYFYDKIEGRFSNLRADNTLFMYLLKRIWLPFDHYCDRIAKKYNVRKSKYTKWDGQGVSLLNRKGTIYIVEGFIFSKRFSTDGLGNYFHEKAIRSKYGIDDAPSFEQVKMSLIEMLQVHSHIYTELARLFKSDEWEHVKATLDEWTAEWREKRGIKTSAQVTA